MIKKRLLTGAFATLLAAYAPNVVAQQTEGCSAFTVLDYTKGTLKNGNPLTAADRIDPAKALGTPEANNGVNTFVSLGYGGSLTLGFDGAVYDAPGKDIWIFETSYSGANDCSFDGVESAIVELSSNGVDFFPAGTVCRDGSVDIADAGLSYVTAIRITNDPASTTPDGYDVDGILVPGGCAELPPAGCFAVSIYDHYQGTQWNGSPITDPIRITPEKALFQPENDRSSGADNFFSLGNGGWIILEMGGYIMQDGTSAPDLRVYETTWGNLSCASYPEYAEVSVSPNGTNWYSLGVVCQSSNISLDLDAAVPGGVRVKYVKIATDTAGGNTQDYFDVDGVEALWGCDDFNPEQPQGCFAACVAEAGYVQGTKRNGSALPVERTNWEKALGTPEESDVAPGNVADYNFVSLGYGGSLTLCFGGYINNDPGDDIEIIETSFGNPSCTTYPEYADIWVSADGTNWYFVETGCHNFAVDFDSAVDADNNPVYLPYVQYVKIANNDTLSTTPDAYDVDGVKILASQCEETQAPVTQPIAGGTSPLIRTYPNPTRGLLNFLFTSHIDGPSSVEVFTTAGQRVAVPFQGDVQAGKDNTITYDMSSLSNGIYITKITTPAGVTTGKVMLAR